MCQGTKNPGLKLPVHVQNKPICYKALGYKVQSHKVGHFPDNKFCWIFSPLRRKICRLLSFMFKSHIEIFTLFFHKDNLQKK